MQRCSRVHVLRHVAGHFKLCRVAESTRAEGVLRSMIAHTTVQAADRCPTVSLSSGRPWVHSWAAKASGDTERDIIAVVEGVRPGSGSRS
jgi:hypothetical protein